MLDMNFPTVDPKDPYAFTPEEADIMERLERAFMNCEKLQQHMKFLLAKGSLYKVYNNNLLYHGCVPLNKDGTFKEVEILRQSNIRERRCTIFWTIMSARGLSRSIRRSGKKAGI